MVAFGKVGNDFPIILVEERKHKGAPAKNLRVLPGLAVERLYWNGRVTESAMVHYAPRSITMFYKEPTSQARCLGKATKANIEIMRFLACRTRLTG